MRGGYLHNHVLLDPIEEHFRLLRAETRREQPTRSGRSAGFVDLFVKLEGRRIACEAELSADRVLTDIEKAQALGAELLLVVVPNGRVARAARRRVRRSTVDRADLLLWILPLGPMLQRIRRSFPLFSTLNVLGKTNNKSPNDDPEVHS